MLCLSKIVSPEQISSHFRLKTKSQDEFNNKINNHLKYLFTFEAAVKKQLFHYE
tara:strand:- start:12575 stop:12736 length:162 start_codon:yes stop_codon:yes gene_type:complete